MNLTRTRRILKRAALGVSAIVVTLASYLSSWLTVSVAANEGLIDMPLAESTEPIYKPINCIAAPACRDPMHCVTFGTNLCHTKSVNPDQASIGLRFRRSRLRRPNASLVANLREVDGCHC